MASNHRFGCLLHWCSWLHLIRNRCLWYTHIYRNLAYCRLKSTNWIKRELFFHLHSMSFQENGLKSSPSFLQHKFLALLLWNHKWISQVLNHSHQECKKLKGSLFYLFLSSCIRLKKLEKSTLLSHIESFYNYYYYLEIIIILIIIFLIINYLVIIFCKIIINF